MIRGNPACVVTRPNVPELRLACHPPAVSSLPGTPQLNVLNRLNASRRSSRLRVDRRPSWRDTARSTVQYFGPTSEFLMKLPYVPGAGCANAAGLKYWVNVLVGA